MPNHPVTTVLRIKEDCGHDEAWPGEQIVANANILGLGDLVVRDTERRQSKGGRLDILLERPGDASMYEVELQLGDTDPSHIIRSIEYWDREKRRWPKKKHKAVLVAEKITTRFFNVVQLLSKAVPIIGIQVNIVQIGESQALHFTTIINTSDEEEDEEEEGPQTDENYWRDNYPSAHECAMWYRDLLVKAGGDVRAKFTKGWITLYLGGKVRASVPARKNNRAQIYIQKLDEKDLQEAEDQLNAERPLFTRNEEIHLVFTGNLKELKDTQAAHEWIARRLMPDATEAMA
jgi:hypothetical protein